MIDRLLVRLREPRAGITFMSAILAVLMASHWAPLMLPGLVVLVLTVGRPSLAERPIVWWVMSAIWVSALFGVPQHMEDHVLLFCAWLVALALGLHNREESGFLASVSGQARVLMGVTFTAAVAWKLWFGDFLTGTALWIFVIIDGRFAPLAAMLGLDSDDLARDRAALTDVLEGGTPFHDLEASAYTTIAFVVVAIGTLLVEGLIAASHLAPDSARLARLRIPSVVGFAVLTYGVVPVLPFAALLAVLTMVASRWRREVSWVFPVVFLVASVRLVTLSL